MATRTRGRDGRPGQGERRDPLPVPRSSEVDGTLAAAFGALARIRGDFLPEGRRQGAAQEREAL